MFNSAVSWISTLILYILETYPLYLIAAKSGQENAWLAFVPLVNIWMMFQLADVDLWLALLLLLPGIDLLVLIWVWMRIAESTNKSSFWGILMVVPVVNLAVAWYLAVYEPPTGRLG